MTNEEFERSEISFRKMREILAETKAGLHQLDIEHRKTEAAQQRTEATFRWAVRLGALEARRIADEHRRLADQRLDEAFGKLAAAQAATEEALRRYFESRQGNGDSPKA